MSPILLRPIREQVEHDRVIRQLHVRFRRRYAVAVNVGDAETSSVRVLGQTVYPDLVLTGTAQGRRLHALVEVETAESVHHLEALAQWARFAKARAEFHLYVPAGTADVAQRLCADNGINVTEIWTYYPVGQQIRFTMAHRSDSAKRAALARKGAPAKASKAKTTATRARRAAKATAAPKKRVAKAAKKKTATKTGAKRVAKARPVRSKQKKK